MQNQIHSDTLQHKYRRDADHKLRFARFMSDNQHCHIHCRGTAERGEQEQRALFNAPTAFSSGTFIMNRDDNSD